MPHRKQRTPRKPATKLAKLRKKMRKDQVHARIGRRNQGKGGTK